MIRSMREHWEAFVGDAHCGTKAISDDPATLTVVVPSCDRPIVPLPPERRRQFIEHLDKVLAEATEILTNNDGHTAIESQFSHRTSGSARPSPLLVINGCSTCRGYCCKAGQTTALLSAEFLAWQMMGDPQATTSSLKEEYLARLPDESFNDSCVFHAADGCRLPRRLRNNICNEFHCEGLVDAADAQLENPSAPSIAIAVADGQPQRIGFAATDAPRAEVAVNPIVV